MEHLHLKSDDYEISVEQILLTFPANIYWKDVEGKYLGCNLCQAEFLKLSSPEIIKGKTDFDFYTVSEAEKLRAIDLAVMQSKEAKTLKEESTLPNLGKVQFLSKKTPLFDLNKEVIGLFGLSIQIDSEENEVQKNDVEFVQQLTKQIIGKVEGTQNLKECIEDIRHYFESIIALLPGHVYWQDTNNVFLGCNNLQAKHAGLTSRHDIVGKTNHDMIWKDQADALNSLNRKVIDTGIPYVAEEVATMTNGTRPYLSHKTPLKNRSGQIIGILGVSLDILELKQAQEKLIKTEKSEARFKTLSAVGGMIAHELRTPLATIRNSSLGIERFLPHLIEGYKKAVAENLLENPLRKDLLSSVEESTRQIHQALAYSESTITTILAGLHYSNTQALSDIATKFLLKSAVTKALKQYPLNSQQRLLIEKIQVNQVKVLGEEQILIHVIHNLLKNAIHSISSAGKGLIQIHCIDQNKTVNLIFRDTGKGIQPDDLPHIFEPFYTTKKESAQSVGLGLYFCKIALQKMGAEIQCNSEWEKHTQFTITLQKSH